MTGIITATLATSYFFVFFLPNKDAMRLKEQESSKNLNTNKEKQNVGNIASANQISDTTSTQPISGASGASQINEASVYSEQTQEDLAKEKKKAYEAQLKIDKAAYNSAIDKLTRDYNHAVDALRAKEAAEGGREVSSSDCGGNGTQIQECAVAQRIHDKYQIEYDYLEETYKANLKAIGTTKYW